jgi:hypothetical protein
VEHSGRQWRRVDDHLCRGQRIQAIAAAREEFGFTLRESIEAVHDRWTALKSTVPDRFLVPLDGYCDAVYT